jgi:Kef-type K+ transport system membrane component KefB
MTFAKLLIWYTVAIMLSVWSSVPVVAYLHDMTGFPKVLGAFLYGMFISLVFIWWVRRSM